MKTLTLLLLLPLLTCGCGTHAQMGGPDLSAASVFPLAVGQKWDMRDNAGQLTHFSVLPFGPEAGCRKGEFVDIHIAKDSPEPYPDAGGGGYRISQADWIAEHVQGSWRLTSFMWTNKADGFYNTWQLVSLSYWFVLPSANGSTNFKFNYGITNMQNLLVCMPSPAIQGNPEAMALTDTVESVSTPVYAGPTVKQDWCEQDNPPACDRAHEVWWYAPGLGVVQIQIQGPNTADGPIGYTTRRIN